MLRLEQPDIFHMVGGYLITASALDAALRVNIPIVVSLTDYWWICPRISLLRTNGDRSTLPIDPARCVRCLAEEKRRFRLPGKVFPALMDMYWSQQHDRIAQVEERTRFLLSRLNQADAILCPSNFLRDMYAQVGIEPEKMHYIRQGRDFPNLTDEMKEKTPSPVLRLGFIGQIARLKGVHVLVDAVRSMPSAPVEVIIYGELSAYPKYTDQIRQLIGGDTRIRLAGTYQNLTDILRQIDVVVVPSLWYENSPNSILEAFAHCTPVITSNLGGMAELVMDGKNGLLFESGNAADLARTIQCLLDKPDLLNQLRSGIGLVKTLAAEMDELEAAYACLVG
jgi:glycosyltransferase involved in cell wall biosynthesis